MRNKGGSGRGRTKRVGDSRSDVDVDFVTSRNPNQHLRHDQEPILQHSRSEEG